MDEWAKTLPSRNLTVPSAMHLKAEVARQGNPLSPLTHQRFYSADRPKLNTLTWKIVGFARQVDRAPTNQTWTRLGV